MTAENNMNETNFLSNKDMIEAVVVSNSNKPEKSFGTSTGFEPMTSISIANKPSSNATRQFRNERERESE